MLGLIGILFALSLLMYLSYRGLSVLILGPLLALFAALFSGENTLLGLYTQVFMKAMGGFVISYFPLFLVGALFGKLMEDSGAAQSIASWVIRRLGRKHAALAIIMACAILTYGGVSLFVVAFALYPTAAHLFRRLNIPKRLVPACIGLGAFTFTMTALPGSPAIQNTIPAPYFGTTPFAAPGLGIIAALIMFAVGYYWILNQATLAKASGEGYGRHGDNSREPDWEIREHAESEGFDIREIDVAMEGHHHKVPSYIALLPPVVVIVANYILSAHVLPHMDVSYLAQPEFGATSLSAVKGIWSTLLSLILAILVLIATTRKNFKSLRASLDGGANASVSPVFNTASMVGFGAVIACLPAFVLLRDLVLGIGQSNVLLSLGISVNVLAGITGSASGGMSIALQTLGQHYVHAAQEAGLSPELLHRVTTIATGGLDTLPHNGAVITLLGICGMTHRQAYKDLFFAIIPGPLLALAAVVILGSCFGTF